MTVPSGRSGSVSARRYEACRFSSMTTLTPAAFHEHSEQTSPAVRFVAEWSLKACNPPNPVHVVSNEAEAIEAARAYT